MNWTVGPMLELEVPIFDQNQAQVAKAIHEYNQKRAEHEARRQVITRDIRAAWVKHELAREQVEFYRTVLLPDVEANLGLAQEGYVSAREDLTVFLQAQEDLITTRQTILEFLRDYYLSAVELQRAVGGRMPAADAPESPR
jgi:cobalt-zinc-cadmium efflux system outer membrane protein